MVRRESPDNPLPEYHERLLVVRLQPDLRSVALAMPAAAVPAPAMVAGLASAAVAVTMHVQPVASAIAPLAPAIGHLLKSGMVRRIVPLARQSTTGLADPMRSLAAAFADRPGRAQALVSGTAFLELEKGVDVASACNQIAHDAQTQFVARVPMRYALVRRAGARTPSARSRPAAAAPTSILWNLAKIQWPEARRASSFRDATSVKVAVLDTGIDRNHPDLKGRVSSYVYEHPDDTSVSGSKDLVGHGTHVTGTIGATIGNRTGIDGICTCDLRVWKIFTDQPEFINLREGFAYVVDPIMYNRALADCADDQIDVINLSIGGPAPPDPQERQLFDALMAGGTVICAAMGNERALGSPTSYPAAIQDVIAVGATSVNDAVAGFSNRGDHIALCAPGKGIWSTLPTYDGQLGFAAVRQPDGSVREGKPYRRERDYDSWDGTSMACPHVTAAVALHVASRGASGASGARKALQKTADRVPGMDGKAFHPDYGAGRLNLRKLLV